MKTGFLIFLCFFLVSCVSGGKYAEQKFFIDSNVAADVYCDGKYIGTTPLELDTSLKCELKIEKEGYSPSSFRFQNLEKYMSFPKDEISKHHGLLSSAIEPINDFINDFLFADYLKAPAHIREKYAINFISVLSARVAVFSPIIAVDAAFIVMEGALDILALPVDLASIGTYASKNGSIRSENSSATSYNATSIDLIIPYDGDSFFFELLSKDKKTFSRQDLHELRTKLFVLKNFNELKIASPEYARTLATLTGKPFITPAPEDNPSDYFRTLGYQKKLQ